VLASGLAAGTMEPESVARDHGDPEAV